jgi:LmbE family N-acetylglucosaminyl deacetylase
MRVMAITAHPHYSGANIAGTLYKHAQRGDEVFVVSMTAGDLMTTLVTKEELAKINKRDMENAAAILGIKEFRILGYQDGEVANTLEVRVALNRVIRELKPDVVLTHWYPGNTLPDFKYTGDAVQDAIFCALLVQGRWAAELPSHWTSRAYAFEEPCLTVGFEPTTYVDVTNVLDVKLKSIDCFAIHCEANYGGDYEKFHSSYLGPARLHGMHSGVVYAEAFQQLKTHEVHTKALDYLF